MASIHLSKGTWLYKKDQPVDTLYLLISGKIKMICQGFSYELEKGDIVGLLESCSAVHVCDCVMQEDSVLMPISYSRDLGINPIINGNRDMTNLFSISLFRQILFCFDLYHTMLKEHKRTRHYLLDSYSTYLQMCEEHSFAPIRLAAVDELQELTFARAIDEWEYSFYKGLHDIFGHQVNDTMVSNPDILNGFTLKAFYDVRRCISCCNEIREADASLASCLLNENKKDIYECFHSLVVHTSPNDPDYDIILMHQNELRALLASNAQIDQNLLVKRDNDMEQKIKDMNSSGNNSLISSLHDSARFIIEFSRCGKPLDDLFLHALEKYKALPDKFSVDDNARAIRHELTKQFYAIYAKVYLRSKELPDVPEIIKMFLNFGYVDEDLAGIENISYLFTLCTNLPTAPSRGVYSIEEWLDAILEGKKQPSRNEFDQDYTAYLKEQRVQGNLTPAEEAAALDDTEQRVLYEITNMFPLVNKMTYGRISSFCPVFYEGNIGKSLKNCLLSADLLTENIDRIREIDYSAFYRETSVSYPEVGIHSEFIQIEVLPDIILLPNIGTRPVMWQEIEGKKRTTPARMMLSIFFTEDLFSRICRLVGEYRWEMCRRIQGVRWNDVSDRSLTSEFCDYMQFYRKNRELSSEVKEKIKGSLTKFRNSFKELFIQDYCTWIVYESAGSPRLNKVSRAIVHTYCPFSLKYRDVLRANPLYTDLFERYETKQNSQIHRLNNVFTKFHDHVPPELEEYMTFLQK